MKDNKFFTVYGIVTALAVIGSGFFFFKAWSGDKAQMVEFSDTADNVKLLKGKKLFPNSANLKAKEEQVTAYIEKSEELRKKLIAAQRELKPVQQQEFPNILLSTYEKTSDYAKSKDIELPENFYLGMEVYRNGLPPQKAVSTLEWQLDGINTLVNILLESGVTSISKLERPMLDIEQRDTDKDENPRGGSNSSGGPAGGKGNEVPYEPDAVMDTLRFTVTFEGDHDAFVDSLNRISNDSSFFYWVRAMRVENEKKEGPSRVSAFQPQPVEIDFENVPAEPAPPVEPEPAPAPEDAAPAEDPAVEGAAPAEDGVPAATVEPEENVFAAPAMIDVREIFGTEKVKAQLIVDLVRFKEDAAPEDENSNEATPAN